MTADGRRSGNLAEAAGHLLAVRRIQDWRDAYLLRASLALSDGWAELRPRLVERIAAAPLRRLLLSPSSVIKAELLPTVTDRLQADARAVLRDADAELQRVGREDTLVPLFDMDGGGDDVLTALTDTAGSIGAIFGGAAVASAIPTAGITTTAGFLGFGAATVVSWPVVIGGGAIAGVAVATGLLRTSKLKSRQADALMTRLDDVVARAVFSRRPADKSLLVRVESAIEDTASTLLKSFSL